MGTRVDEHARTPWAAREAAMRRLGPIRKVLADQAADGVLPSPEQVEQYRERQAAFDAAHRFWLERRAAAAS